VELLIARGNVQQHGRRDGIPLGLIDEGMIPRDQYLLCMLRSSLNQYISNIQFSISLRNPCML